MSQNMELDAGDLVSRLRDLCHPEAEVLPDGMRLTALIKAGHEAAALIEELRGERDKLREASIMAREWMSSVEAPLCDTTAFKRDRDTIDRALSLKETAP